MIYIKTRYTKVLLSERMLIKVQISSLSEHLSTLYIYCDVNMPIRQLVYHPFSRLGNKLEEPVLLHQSEAKSGTNPKMCPFWACLSLYDVRKITFLGRKSHKFDITWHSCSFEGWFSPRKGLLGQVCEINEFLNLGFLKSSPGRNSKTFNLKKIHQNSILDLLNTKY